MRTSIHATLVALALAQQALAQLVVPACFQACGDTAAQQLGCNDRSNYACYCGNQQFILAQTQCALQQCPNLVQDYNLVTFTFQQMGSTCQAQCGTFNMQLPTLDDINQFPITRQWGAGGIGGAGGFGGDGGIGGIGIGGIGGQGGAGGLPGQNGQNGQPGGIVPIGQPIQPIPIQPSGAAIINNPGPGPQSGLWYPNSSPASSTPVMFNGPNAVIALSLFGFGLALFV